MKVYTTRTNGPKLTVGYRQFSGFFTISISYKDGQRYQYYSDVGHTSEIINNKFVNGLQFTVVDEEKEEHVQEIKVEIPMENYHLGFYLRDKETEHYCFVDSKVIFDCKPEIFNF